MNIKMSKYDVMKNLLTIIKNYDKHPNAKDPRVIVSDTPNFNIPVYKKGKTDFDTFGKVTDN